jgi:serine/threonine protein kinase
VNSLQPGYEIGKGRYIFKKKLGEGGFGITFLAEDKNSSKQVVVKTLNENMRHHPDFRYFREKFNNEAVKLAQCNHPHIVKLMDEIIYDESEWPYLVMEYIAGKNLERYIKEECGFLQQKEALRYGLQIADALRAVHQMKLFHLDVNPRNIIIRSDKKEAVLIDFGTSRRADADLKSVINEFISRSYAPIERYRQLEQGAYTDVYGLSATLYFMLAGRDPEAADTRDRLTKLGRPDPLMAPIISSDNSDEKIEERVEQAILQGLALEPEDRPQSIQKWLNLLGIGNTQKVVLQKTEETENESLVSTWSNTLELLVKAQLTGLKYGLLIFPAIVLIKVLGNAGNWILAAIWLLLVICSSILHKRRIINFLMIAVGTLVAIRVFYDLFVGNQEQIQLEQELKEIFIIVFVASSFGVLVMFIFSVWKILFTEKRDF